MISIIIPTYHESEIIGRLLKHVVKCCSGREVEIIVVDATNCDLTKREVLFYGAKFIVSEKGRSRQMNTGAWHASNQVLYFLHADSYPPLNFDNLLMDSLQGNTVAGCFYMAFDSRHPVLRTSGWLTRFNSNWCRGGDQSLFIKKDLFKQIGGFNEEYTILEDNEIIPRIRSHGKFVVVKKKLITSARRYEENGVFRLQVLFAFINLGHGIGISQTSLLNFYKKHVVQ